MSAPQFTQGPWAVRTDRRMGHDRMVETWYVHTPSNRVGIAVQPAFSDDTNAQANARLIAAAPELYEALSELLECCQDDDPYGAVPLLDKAAAALAKARGEQ